MLFSFSSPQIASCMQALATALTAHAQGKLQPRCRRRILRFFPVNCFDIFKAFHI